MISTAESAGFGVFVTTDKNLKYQQNLLNRSMAIVVLQTTSWPKLQKVLPSIVDAVNAATPGSYAEVAVE